MHKLLMEIASGRDVEENQLMLDRQIESLARKGFNRQSIERNIAIWVDGCIQGTACHYSRTTDEWFLDDQQAQSLYCSEYQSLILLH